MKLWLKERREMVLKKNALVTLANDLVRHRRYLRELNLILWLFDILYRSQSDLSVRVMERTSQFLRWYGIRFEILVLSPRVCHPSSHSSATSTHMWGTGSSWSCNNSSGSSFWESREKPKAAVARGPVVATTSIWYPRYDIEMAKDTTYGRLLYALYQWRKWRASDSRLFHKQHFASPWSRRVCTD